VKSFCRLVSKSFPVLTVALLLACSGVTREWEAATAAQKYYELLSKGDAVRFMEGKAGVDSLPADYCEQLLKAVEQYQSEIQQKHSGLREVRISDNGGQADTLQNHPYVKAFLILCYGDSTEEEVVVPMIEEHGTWRMK